MPENPYIRQVSIVILELVPDRENLPYCAGITWAGDQCPHRARYDVNGNPSCGTHVRSLSFVPVQLRRKSHGAR